MKREHRIIFAAESGISIRGIADVTDLVSACIGSRGVILTETDLCDEFFDLHTGLAGELIQKCVNYRIRAAIVIASPETHGKRFAELAYEHSTHPMVRFVRAMKEAESWLRADEITQSDA